MGSSELIKVRDLMPNSKHVNIRVKVLSVGEERSVISRFDGSEHRVAEALVGDETGVILLTLWNDNIDLIREKEDSTIIIRNGYISIFRNTMRLNLGRRGTVEDSDVEIEEVNTDNNLSEQVIPGRPRFQRRRNRRR